VTWAIFHPRLLLETVRGVERELEKEGQMRIPSRRNSVRRANGVRGQQFTTSYSFIPFPTVNVTGLPSKISFDFS
jgi:hypothetical protein